MPGHRHADEAALPRSGGIGQKCEIARRPLTDNRAWPRRYLSHARAGHEERGGGGETRSSRQPPHSLQPTSFHAELASLLVAVLFHFFSDFRTNGTGATTERKIFQAGLTHLREAAAHVLFVPRAENKKRKVISGCE